MRDLHLSEAGTAVWYQECMPFSKDIFCIFRAAGFYELVLHKYAWPMVLEVGFIFKKKKHESILIFEM